MSLYTDFYPLVQDLINKIEVNVSTTILETDLQENKINIILVNTAGITITLPTPSLTKLVLLQKNFAGTGDFDVIRQ